MPDDIRRERPPLVFPIVLIVVGALFLFAKFIPSFDPWYVMKTYWPLILIFIGLAKIYDSSRAARSGGANTGSWSAGATIGLVAFVVVMIVLLSHRRVFSRNRHFTSNTKHQTQHVDLQYAKSINASIQSPAGDLTVDGGSS